MTATFREVTPDDYEQLRQFLSDQGWAERVKDLERFRTMLQGSALTVVAVDGDTIVGFARALCDGASNAYISTVAVAPDRRGQGIGRELVERLMSRDTDGGSHGYCVQGPTALASGRDLDSHRPQSQWNAFANSEHDRGRSDIGPSILRF